MRTIELTIAVIAVDRADMERQLDEAVTVARKTAMYDRRQRILVTRHDYDSFTVALTDAVHFGLTREQQGWGNHGRSDTQAAAKNPSEFSVSNHHYRPPRGSFR